MSRSLDSRSKSRSMTCRQNGLGKRTCSQRSKVKSTSTASLQAQNRIHDLELITHEVSHLARFFGGSNLILVSFVALKS